ncbi:hypothetical protein DFH08DRAFT_833454 [Mycena albidolilacea]|uniref:Uncharacterized protein n=1 Tax=Mycena albidolilacea TaxID=1033008 RepID=A0AAD7F4X8_9AGAR|nr:hypothetical protein DFH08DRAFT_833454 [Mycena albidolilacea]
MIPSLSCLHPMSYVIQAAFLHQAWTSIEYDVSKTCTVLVLYTIYVVLFLFSIYTLIHRNSRGRRFMLVTSSTMFLLGTSGMLFTVVQMTVSLALFEAQIECDAADLERLERSIRLYNNLAAASMFRVVVNNLLTDVLLSYRCYIIWGSRRIVLIVPGILILATCVVGSLGTVSRYFFDKLPFSDLKAPFALAGATNLILMCLTAGRIWYMSREARNRCALRKRYHAVIAMIVESGALYWSVILLEIVSRSLVSQSYFAEIFQGICDGLLDHMINIIPTLIFVRVGMGYGEWHQKSAPITCIPAVHTRRRPEDRFPEDMGSEVIDIKWTGV